MSNKQLLYFSIQIAIIASIIGGVSNTPFNVMPMILGSAADNFDLLYNQMGLLGGITLLGWVAGTFICFLILKRVNWRLVGIVGILVAAVGVQISLLSDSVSALYIAWFILGIGCSLPTCVVFEVVAQTQNPERSFGMLVFSIVVISALVLYVFPAYILPHWRYIGLVWGFSGMLLLSSVLVWKLPSKQLPRHEAGIASDQDSSNGATWIACAALLIFFTGQSGLWAFLERVGTEIDLPSQDIGLVLSILKMVGGLACVVAMIVAIRFGNRWPFIVGFIGIVYGIYLLDTANSLIRFAAGGWVWEFFFTLVFCYTSAAISRLDKTGQVVVLVPGVIGLAGAAGPIIAGYLKTGDSFMPIYIFTATCMFICMCVFLILLNRKSGIEQQSPEALVGVDSR